MDIASFRESYKGAYPYRQAGMQGPCQELEIGCPKLAI